MANGSFSSTLLQGKIGLVTGAGSGYGIGRSIVLAAVAAGVKAIYACDLNSGNFVSLQEAAQKINPSCHVEGRVLDVSSESDTVALLKEITKKHGRFDLYFPNAGFANVKNINDLGMKEYTQAMDIMATGVFYAVKHGSKAMAVVSSEKTAPGGAIVVTASVAAAMGSFSDLCYSTAKSAAFGLIHAGAVNLSASNIRINGIAPGATQTSLLANSAHIVKGEKFNVTMTEKEGKDEFQKYIDVRGVEAEPQYYYNRLSQPEEIAHIAIFLASDLATAINGHVLYADKGKTQGALGESYIGPVPTVEPLDLS